MIKSNKMKNEEFKNFFLLNFFIRIIKNTISMKIKQKIVVTTNKINKIQN